MALKDTQKQVNDWVSQYEVPYWTPHEILTRITEADGEQAREQNHEWGPKKKKETEHTKEVADELSDVLFSIICFANSQGIDLDEAFRKTMDKCYKRDVDRFEKKKEI